MKIVRIKVHLGIFYHLDKGLRNAIKGHNDFNICDNTIIFVRYVYNIYTFLFILFVPLYPLLLIFFPLMTLKQTNKQNVGHYK